MSAQEALKAGVIDYIAVNVPDLLHQLDGREIKLDTGNTITLDTKTLQVTPVEADWRTQLLGIIANPQVAVVLMMIGIYGLFFEMTNPGMALPGVAGLICLLLGLYAFQVLPVNWAGVALIAVGTVLMIVEVFMPSFGVIGAGGLVAFILGGLLLTDTNVPGFDVSVPFLVGTAIVGVVLLILLGAMASRAHRKRVVSGREEMLGLRGEVTSIEHDVVYADVRGERWRVESSVPLAVHDTVRVVAIDGLKLRVDRIDRHPAS